MVIQRAAWSLREWHDCVITLSNLRGINLFPFNGGPRWTRIHRYKATAHPWLLLPSQNAFFLLFLLFLLAIVQQDLLFLLISLNTDLTKTTNDAIPSSTTTSMGNHRSQRSCSYPNLLRFWSRGYVSLFLSKSIILNSRVSFLFFTLTDLEICRVAPREVTGTYTFDFPSSKGYRYSDALTHSRAKLMEEMSKLGYNFLIMEGSVPSFFSLPSSKTLNGSCFKLKFRWSITTMRKSKAERIEVRYHAQPAVARGWQRPRTPPYLQLLESH